MKQLSLFGNDSSSKQWNSDCWRTPNTTKHPILNLARQTFNDSICLDPCTASDNPTDAKYFFTQSDNFLLQEPQRTYPNCWLNPPFSKPAPFLEKLVTWYSDRHIMQAIALLKSGTVHNQSTSHLIAQSQAICFWRSPRIAFIDESGTPRKNADFDCILVYFGSTPHSFHSVFQPFGLVLLT